MVIEKTLPVLTGLTETERAVAIRAAFERNRRQMVLLLARQLGVPEVDVVRAMPEELVEELNFSQWEEIIRSFENLGDVHVIVSNGASTLEVVGQFGKFSNAQGFFNVQTKSLDMHIRSQALAAVFAVRKPSHTDGKEALSFQFFDKDGQAAFKVFLTFGGKDPSAERWAQYNEIIERFRVD
ncbi:MAG: ChuX/HutX family heme-like substrate-binding protein [Anaerolineales bacterium]